MQDSAKNRFSRRGYTARKVALVVFVIAYTVVADWGGRVSPNREFFPVFNWSLFTHVNPYPLQPELHVVSIGDTRFDKPVNYFDLGSYFDSARQRSSTVQKTVRRLRAAVLANDEPEIARLRKIIETRHLSGHGPIEYEIRSVQFDAIERWKNKNYTAQETVVARFTTEDAE